MSVDKQVETFWYDRLRADYPGFATCFPECNEGWDGVLRGFFDAVVATGVKPDQFSLAQIKEKWGDLVIYYHLGDGVDDDIQDRIQKAYDTAQKASRVTCEITGTQGVMIDRGGWYMTRSPEFIEPGDKVLTESIPDELRGSVEKALAATVA